MLTPSTPKGAIDRMKLDARLQAAADAAALRAVCRHRQRPREAGAVPAGDGRRRARRLRRHPRSPARRAGSRLPRARGWRIGAAFVLSDGLDALPERPDVAAVCGMGGELIADIVARALRRFPAVRPCGSYSSR